MRIRKSKLKCSDEEIINAYKEGKSLSEIINILPVSQTGAWKVLRMYGIESRPTSRVGIKHHNWRGDDVGYVAVHSYIRRHFGKPNKCVNPTCLKISNNYEWANVKGHKYSRNGDDYIMLCRSCHRRMDYGLIKLNYLTQGKTEEKYD